MNATEILAQVRVASPCLARWADMTGDERTRFCHQCQKQVYNLSEMTAEQAAALIREKEGRLCARFYQRSDGSMLTADCPVGAARSRTRKRRFAMAAGLALFLGGSFFALGRGPSESGGRQRQTRLTRAWNDAVWKVKGWLGLQPPPRMIMGDICPRPPTPPPSSPQTPKSGG